VKAQAICYNLGPLTTHQTIAPFAAAVYKPDTGDRMALLKFVEKQKSLNIRVGGVGSVLPFSKEALQQWWQSVERNSK